MKTEEGKTGSMFSQFSTDTRLVLASLIQNLKVLAVALSRLSNIDFSFNTERENDLT